MDTHTVIARAFRGQPLKMVVIEATDRSVYLANPSRLRDVVSGDSMPVGFPIEDVYLFEMSAFSNLAEEWEKTGRTRDEVWAQLRRFRTLGRR